MAKIYLTGSVTAKTLPYFQAIREALMVRGDVCRCVIDIFSDARPNDLDAWQPIGWKRKEALSEANCMIVILDPAVTDHDLYFEMGIAEGMQINWCIISTQSNPDGMHHGLVADIAYSDPGLTVHSTVEDVLSCCEITHSQPQQGGSQSVLTAPSPDDDSEF